MDVVAKLRKLSAELESKREELRVSAEQLSFLQQVADEAHREMLVQASPLARREHAERVADLERHQRLHSSIEKQISAMEGQQDSLLEQM